LSQLHKVLYEQVQFRQKARTIKVHMGEKLEFYMSYCVGRNIRNRAMAVPTYLIPYIAATQNRDI